MSVFKELNPEGAEQVCAPCVTKLSRDSSQYIPMYCLRYQQPFRTVLMAVASRHGSKRIRYAFEEASEFLIYEASCHEVKFVGSCKPLSAHCDDDESSALEKTIHALDGCEVVLCSRIDHKTWHALEQAGIEPNNKHASESVEDAIRAVYHGMLSAGRLAGGVTEATIDISALA